MNSHYGNTQVTDEDVRHSYADPIFAQAVAAATPTTFGQVKLYATVAGNNTDGPADQNSVNLALATKLNLSGGTMTGDLILASDPTVALQAATKQYVDNAIGAAVVPATPTTYGVVKLYATVAGNNTDGPADQNSVNLALATKLDLAGGHMTGTIYFDTSYGIDAFATGGSDILNIGNNNADVINIGTGTNPKIINVGSQSTLLDQINIYGTIQRQDVTNLTVTDKLVTYNAGGAAGSGFGSGWEGEENGIITYYFKTNAARTGFDMLAPAQSSVLGILLSSLTANRNLTAPDVSGTIATIDGGQTFTSAVWNGTAIANAYLANSTITVNGASTALGSSVTITTTGTANRISVSGGGGLTPTIDIDAAYVGQSSITTLGTITTGTWSASTIAANKGGTGFSSYAVGDILYADTTSTLAKLADVSVGSYLRSGGVTTAPLWSTLKLPNTATANYIPYATATNTWGESANLTYDGTTVTLTSDTSTIKLRSLVGTTSSGAIYIDQGSPGAVNYTLASDGSMTMINGPTSSGQVQLLVNNSARITANNASLQFTTGNAAGGSSTKMNFAQVAQTSATAGTEVISVQFDNSTTLQHASNTLVATQRTMVFNGMTYTFASAGGVITDAVTLEISAAPTAGTNASITRAWAARFIGNTAISTKLYVGASTTAPTATIHLAAGTTAASSAPLKFTSGTNMTTAEAGAFEYDGTNLFFTRTGTTRETAWCGNSGAAAPATNAIGVIVDYYGTSATRVLTTPNSWGGVVIGGTTYKIPLYT